MKKIGDEAFREVRRKITEDIVPAWEDPGHPGWHLTTPAHFMIDCWGALFYQGYYHMFVDVNPNRGEVGPESIFWHVRSKDLLHWEHLPLPLLPDEQELRTNDGWIGFDDQNRPILLYTGVPKSPEELRYHRAAFASKDLSRFERVPGEPFLTLQNHGGPEFAGGWSDPYVFEANGKKYLIVSKCVLPDGSEPLPVYEAEDGSLQHWKYLGNLFGHNGEVVNFFPMGDRWVLIYSPYRAAEAFVGTLDTDTMRFIPETHAILSYGYHSQANPIDRGFYATTLYSVQDRNILCGWISGFHSSEYWDGCMGAPRELSLSEDHYVIQKPIFELKSLRVKALFTDRTEDGAVPFDGMADVELVCRFETEEAYLSISVGEEFRLTLTKKQADCLGDVYPLGFEELHVRLLFDRSVCELFFGDSDKNCGKVAASRCFSYIQLNKDLFFESADTEFTANAWRLKEVPQVDAEQID